MKRGRERRADLDFDVVIVGAGIVGAMIARELSRFEGRWALLDKEGGSGFGVSKANPCMLHSPLMFPTGPLRLRLAHQAAGRYRRLAEELDVAFREVGEMFLAFDTSQVERLRAAQRQAEERGVSAGHSMIGPEAIRKLEPNVNPGVLAALYAEGAVGGIHAPEWTFALLETAQQNGLQVFLNSEVKGIQRQAGRGYVLITPAARFRTRRIVNAAGLFADDLACRVGDRDIQLKLTKGTMAILDKSAAGLVRNMLYGSYGPDHSQLVTPTAHGNILVGLGRFSAPAHKADTKVEAGRLQEVLQAARELVPALSDRDVIAAFAGIRSENSKAAGGDFHIAPSERAPGVIHAFVGSPGLTAAPAIAELVVQLLGESGLQLKEKKDFRKHRAGWPRFGDATDRERRAMIAQDPGYGHVLCRCERVTEAEIKAAVRRGADTMDGVKHLTRAGMGRCQGGFCGPSVLNLLARELGIVPTAVTKAGAGSWQLGPARGQAQERSCAAARSGGTAGKFMRGDG